MAPDPTFAPTQLAARAAYLLRGNDLGSMTTAAPLLYPHMWSWDAAFVAIGLAPLSVDAKHLLGALGLGAVSYGLSILLYITAAQNLGATRSQLIFSSSPFIGLLIASALGEPLTLIQGIAIFLIQSGYVLSLLLVHHRLAN